jgi:hypothetical protein
MLCSIFLPDEQSNLDIMRSEINRARNEISPISIYQLCAVSEMKHKDGQNYRRLLIFGMAVIQTPNRTFLNYNNSCLSRSARREPHEIISGFD